MATASPLCLVTPRDLDLFEALDRCPLTVRQLLKLSCTFAYPFTTERRVQERLQCLVAVGRVRRWPYATAGQGALSYYTLTPLGYRLLHGCDTLPSGRGIFGPVGVARQAHTQALAEVIIHLVAAAERSGIPIENFRRENALRLRVGAENLYPDGAFELLRGQDARFTFYLEIDNRSETVSVGSSFDSWGRKIQFYEKLQDAQSDRFRVLAITTGGPQRLRHMLESAGDLARNPRRSLVYGIGYAAFLSVADPLASPCFRNHLDQSVALVPPAPPVHDIFRLTAEPEMVPSAPCLRPFAEV